MVFHFFGLAPGAGLAALERAGRRHCAQEWEPLRAVRGAELQMDQYCFRHASFPGCTLPEHSLCAIGVQSVCHLCAWPKCVQSSDAYGEANTIVSALALQESMH